MYVSVLEGGLGGALGVDGGWLPLPTRLQRYCTRRHLLKGIFKKGNRCDCRYSAHFKGSGPGEADDL